jgi:putative phage-type endonuclease
MESKVFEFETAVLDGVYENGSDAWHEARVGSIGGSEIGTICGLNRWESAVTLFYKKTGQIESTFEPSLAMELGTALEPFILGQFAKRHPEFEVFTTGTYRSTVNPAFHANVDGIGVGSDMVVVEAKYSNDYWIEPPASYVAQVRWYMFVLGLKRAFIVALCGGSYKEFEVVHDVFEEQVLVSMANKFLKNLEDSVQPDWDGSESTYKTMRDLHPDVVAGDVELGLLGVELINAQVAFDSAEAHLNEMKSRTLDALGDAKNGLVDDTRVCYRQNTKTGSPFLKIMKGK